MSRKKEERAKLGGTSGKANGRVGMSAKRRGSAREGV